MIGKEKERRKKEADRERMIERIGWIEKER
jgi:hypothetical protein